MHGRNRVSLTSVIGLCATIFVGTIAAPSQDTFAQPAPPNEGLPQLVDEPVWVPGGLGGDSPELVSTALWPALFSSPYVPGKSAICLVCEVESGKYRASLIEPPESAAPAHQIGYFVEIADPVPVAWIPNHNRFEAGTFEGESYSASQSSQTRAVVGYFVTDGGLWSLVSGTATRTQTAINRSAGNLDFTFDMLSVYSTHTDPLEAIDWTEDFAAGRVFAADEQRPPGGGSTPDPATCDRLRDCKLAADTTKVNQETAAAITRETMLAGLSPTKVIGIGGASTVVGAKAGAFVAGVETAGCPVATLSGGVVGSAFGFIAGVLYAGIDFNAAKSRAEVMYARSMAIIAAAHARNVANCYATYDPQKACGI